MSDDNYEPTKAEFLAGLITGNAGTKFMTASVQRSHRFPLTLFIQIENLARIGDVPVSMVINQLLECGLEALEKELPEEVSKQMSMVQKDQINRPLVSDKGEVKHPRKPKIKPAK